MRARPSFPHGETFYLARDAEELEMPVPVRIVRRDWPHHKARYSLPERAAPAFAVMVRINHGRWIVDCPFCDGAQYASFDHPVRFCTDCLHWTEPAARGAWIPVVWPATVAELEAILAERPEENRNWFPRETLEDLRAENELARNVAETLARDRIITPGAAAALALPPEVALPALGFAKSTRRRELPAPEHRLLKEA